MTKGYDIANEEEAMAVLQQQTSDDTKVGTSGWEQLWVAVDYEPDNVFEICTAPVTSPDCYLVARFENKTHRDACLLAIQSLPKVTAERDRLRDACSRQNEDISQTLGKALGYPWFKDDQKNFPGSTDEHGVCVGDHVAESLADEAAAKVSALSARVKDLEAMIARFLKHHGAYIDALPGGYGVTDLKEARALIGKEPSK